MLTVSGNGLVGRIKKALQLGPFETGNPLHITQIFTGEEPGFVTFEVPISYDLLTNVGALNLSLSGLEATFESCSPATNGNCMLLWETTFDRPGQHYLQARVMLASGGPDARVLAGVGPILPFHSDNLLQFFERGSMFDDASAYLDANLVAADATYTIELFGPSTTPPTLIKSITNSTANGVIQEEWDLAYADGTNVFTGESVKAVFNVTLSGGASGAPSAGCGKKILHRASGALTEWGPNIDVVYMYTPRSGSLASAFAQNEILWNTMLGVVDALTKPVWTYEVYNSYFNRYTHTSWQPYPGYITSRSNVTAVLFPDLTNGVTKQIYWYAHGSGLKMFNASEDVYFTASEVGKLLGNIYKEKGGLVTKSPYRFVFLLSLA